MDAIRSKNDIVTLRSGREIANFDAWVETWVQGVLATGDYFLQVGLFFQIDQFF